MIKANAYGHGMVPIALALSELGVRHFGVATLSEAALLKQNGITSQILLLGGATWLHAVSTLVESDLTPAMSNIEEIATLGNFANQHGLSQVPVHLDLDTGMSRLGFFVGDYPEASLEPVLSTIKRFPCLRVQGIGMHFASADCDQEF